MKFKTECDMGNIKIYNDSMSVFFENGVGDVTTTVEILQKWNGKPHDAKFLGHFTVKDKAFLSFYDCADEPIYEFSKGRWFVELIKPLYLRIYKCDMDLHA